MAKKTKKIAVKEKAPYLFCGTRTGVSRKPCRIYPARETVTMNLLVLGPSNSQKYTACHVPRSILPPLTGMAALQPTMELLTCAAELPSLWR